MSPRLMIRAAGVGKRYTKYDDQPMLLTTMVRIRAATRRSTLWALRGLELEVERSERVGVIGRNGSGKSTLLGLLAGITAPTEGRVEVHGRVAPLVSVGVGFHPELTGRENVAVNGSILGLSREEIAARLDEIVAFAELENFIDTPVKFYSSGMYVRLGFSVAVHANPDVLLVDEILAVGDLAFQVRCYERMMAIRERGTTIVVVSHNLNAIRTICDRTLLLDAGRVVHDGDTHTAITRYHELLGTAHARADGDGVAVASIEGFAVCDTDGQPSGYLRAGRDAVVRLCIRFHQTVKDPLLALSINPAGGGAHLYSDHAPPDMLGSHAAGDMVECEVRLRPSLASGSYVFDAALLAPDRLTVHATAPPITVFVEGRDSVSGVADLDARFEVHPRSVAGH